MNDQERKKQQAKQLLSGILRDADGNRIPDILEGRLSAQDLKQIIRSQAPHKFIYNGVEYNNFEELPPEQQKKLEEQLVQLTKVSGKIGRVLKRFGLFHLIRLFSKQRSYRHSNYPAHPHLRTESSGSFARVLQLLILAIAVGAFVYYLAS